MSVLKSDWHAYIFFKVFVSNFRMPPTSKRGYHHLGDDDDDEEIALSKCLKYLHFNFVSSRVNFQHKYWFGANSF